MCQRLLRKLLRFDLITRTIMRDKITEQDVEMYLGGRVHGDIFITSRNYAGNRSHFPGKQTYFWDGIIDLSQRLAAADYHPYKIFSDQSVSEQFGRRLLLS